MKITRIPTNLLGNLKQVVLYFNANPKSIDFYKGIFLHVSLVCIIDPCYIIMEMSQNIQCILKDTK